MATSQENQICSKRKNSLHRSSYSTIYLWNNHYIHTNTSGCEEPGTDIE